MYASVNSFKDENRGMVNTRRNPMTVGIGLSRLDIVVSSCSFVITIPGIWKNPGAVYPIFRDIHIPGLFDDLVITNSGILKNHGIYFMLIIGMNSLMLHCI